MFIFGLVFARSKKYVKINKTPLNMLNVVV